MARLTLMFIRYFPHLLIIVGALTAGPMVNTDDLAASFPNLFAPIAVFALGMILAFVFPPARQAPAAPLSWQAGRRSRDAGTGSGAFRSTGGVQAGP
ncbi:hypothetical protein [Kitasatospora herbaricolor]|uniref:Uncharacterized protein n=2 Tax=Kitasatospora herbaricolor TaxID=68217 RepID=A0ABZ1W0Q2_9ACTN|nr:hypothetical protein [Kitasatospora herbaricolor]